MGVVGHVMRLNSRTGTEGSPVSSAKCDWPLHSGIRALECNIVVAVVVAMNII